MKHIMKYQINIMSLEIIMIMNNKESRQLRTIFKKTLKYLFKLEFCLFQIFKKIS